MYYAHSRESEPKVKWQLLKEHLTQTAEIAEKFANKFNAGQLGYTVGILHDIGKYSKEFQERLEGSKHPVDHSTAGMQEVFKLYDRNIAKLISYIIAGHHTGLPDAGSENYEGSLINRKIRSICSYRSYEKDIQIPDLSDFILPLNLSDNIAFSCFFFIKMLYSCLVDADFLDTENYMDIHKSEIRGGYASIKELLDFFNNYMETLTENAEISDINKYRNNIYDTCILKAQNDQGLFSLTVPTGGGKTLSSMGFALNHAIKNGMERIIYVIPYTSIIEQNAEVFRKIFGDVNILEHHSNFNFEDDGKMQEVSKKLRLASENWDIPIIVTTNVQFFESIFANKSSKSRKLHNLANSIIILDEAQMLPVQYLKASIMALCELVNNYHTSVVLCTATQPNLNSLLPENIKITEIMDAPELLYEKFRRTQVINIGEIDDDSLAEKIKENNQALCIVNTREHARQLYEKLANDIDFEMCSSEGIYHLSTRMYPLHRKQILNEIRDRLKQGLRCLVISTQLIEAGVDIDFPVVFRSMAGIDSIAQASGRCNREGKRDTANVYVFTSSEEYGQAPREIEINISEAKSVFRNYDDPMSLKGISKYFELLYDQKNIDKKDILKDIKERARSLEFPFSDIARRFKIIENNTKSIIIPADEECENMINELKFVPYKYKILRKLQPYIVNIYDNEFKKLVETGGISVIDKERAFYQLSNIDDFYNYDTGIVRDRDDFLSDTLCI
ncbi:MAG: CRISPR-associated helicase Cas3' [bacterium]